MTQDEIIDRDEVLKMARLAGMYGLVEGGLIEEFEAFAKLVIEKCATVCENTEIEGSLAYGSVCAEKLRSMGETT